MAELRRLTNAGIAEFERWLDELRETPAAAPPTHILESKSHSEPHPSGIASGTLGPVARRFELGLQLNELLKSLKADEAHRDAGLWVWLTLKNIDLVLPADGNGRRRQGARDRYVPSEEWNRRYRHLLRGPWTVVRMHADEPECVEPILSNPVTKPGELYEQVAARMDIIGSKGALRAIRRLYFDEASQKLRHGALGKDQPGTTRRFGLILNQLVLTYHTPDASAEAIVDGLLPRREFSRFAPKGVPDGRA